MTHTSATALGYLFDLRQLDTGVVFGVGLVVSSHRYLSLVTKDDGSALTPELSAEAWSEINAWAADGDARLPARPAPMSSRIVEALLGADAASTISSERFAAIPITVASRPELASLVSRLLPGLLRTRQLAA